MKYATYMTVKSLYYFKSTFSLPGLEFKDSHQVNYLCALKCDFTLVPPHVKALFSIILAFHVLVH